MSTNIGTYLSISFFFIMVSEIFFSFLQVNHIFKNSFKHFIQQSYNHNWMRKQFSLTQCAMQENCEMKGFTEIRVVKSVLCCILFLIIRTSSLEHWATHDVNQIWEHGKECCGLQVVFSWGFGVVSAIMHVMHLLTRVK